MHAWQPVRELAQRRGILIAVHAARAADQGRAHCRGLQSVGGMHREGGVSRPWIPESKSAPPLSFANAVNRSSSKSTDNSFQWLPSTLQEARVFRLTWCSGDRRLWQCR
jgi:hypothetical protein